MKRSDWRGRTALVAAMALALAATPLHAGEEDTESPPEGVGNIIAYSMCAGGIVAGALSGSLNTLLGAMVFCRQLYRDAV
jgi:hypothetical protein